MPRAYSPLEIPSDYQKTLAAQNIRLVTVNVPLDIMIRSLRNKYKLGEFGVMSPILEIPSDYSFVPKDFGNKSYGCVAGACLNYYKGKIPPAIVSDPVYKEFDAHPTEDKAREILGRYGIELRRV